MSGNSPQSIRDSLFCAALLAASLTVTLAAPAFAEPVCTTFTGDNVSISADAIKYPSTWQKWVGGAAPYLEFQVGTYTRHFPGGEGDPTSLVVRQIGKLQFDCDLSKISDPVQTLAVPLLTSLRTKGKWCEGDAVEAGALTCKIQHVELKDK